MGKWVYSCHGELEPGVLNCFKLLYFYCQQITEFMEEQFHAEWYCYSPVLLYNDIIGYSRKELKYMFF